MENMITIWAIANAGRTRKRHICAAHINVTTRFRPCDPMECCTLAFNDGRHQTGWLHSKSRRSGSLKAPVALISAPEFPEELFVRKLPLFRRQEVTDTFRPMCDLRRSDSRRRVALD
ncbi:hypothetical protein CO652_15865 [Rhizobium sp. H4]|nr:hypothetical protein CO652_15865 [Rhizobium sp. H4]